MEMGSLLRGGYMQVTVNGGYIAVGFLARSRHVHSSSERHYPHAETPSTMCCCRLTEGRAHRDHELGTARIKTEYAEIQFSIMVAGWRRRVCVLVVIQPPLWHNQCSNPQLSWPWPFHRNLEFECAIQFPRFRCDEASDRTVWNQPSFPLVRMCHHW